MLVRTSSELSVSFLSSMKITGLISFKGGNFNYSRLLSVLWECWFLLSLFFKGNDFIYFMSPYLKIFVGRFVLVQVFFSFIEMKDDDDTL